MAADDEESRPYPDGVAWDEAWRQRKRADNAEAFCHYLLGVINGMEAQLTRAIIPAIKQAVDFGKARYHHETEGRDDGGAEKPTGAGADKAVDAVERSS